MKKHVAYFIAFSSLAHAATAQEYVLGLGVDDVLSQTDTSSAALAVEYHAEPFYTGANSSIALAGAGQVDGDGDVFVGIGVYALWGLSDRWFVEGSFMPGYYSQGSGGTPLDGNLQFRTLLGVGVRMSDSTRVSLSVDHKSNGGIEDTNPGGETLLLRYTQSF